MKDSTSRQLASSATEQTFYADIELVEVKSRSPGERIQGPGIGALFPAFPKVGERMFCYLNDRRRYLHTSTVESVMVFDEYVTVKTQNSIYALRNIKLHQGDKQ